MRRAWDVLGLPVVCLDTGEEIGVVRDILCDLTWRMLGVVLTETSLFQPGTFIPSEEIRAVGEDFLIVTGKDAVTSLQVLADTETVTLTTGKRKLKGKPVMSADGEFLGVVEDVYFSPGWEKLVGCELSDGWIADVTEGRKRLPVSPAIVWGKEILIVPRSPQRDV